MSNEFRNQGKSSSQEWREIKVNINKSEASFGEDGRRDENCQPPPLNVWRISRQLQDASQTDERKENLNGTVKDQDSQAEMLSREQEV